MLCVVWNVVCWRCVSTNDIQVYGDRAEVLSRQSVNSPACVDLTYLQLLFISTPNVCANTLCVVFHVCTFRVSLAATGAGLSAVCMITIGPSLRSTFFVNFRFVLYESGYQKGSSPGLSHWLASFRCCCVSFHSSSVQGPTAGPLFSFNSV